jgi:hypothetical protein
MASWGPGDFGFRTGAVPRLLHASVIRCNYILSPRSQAIFCGCEVIYHSILVVIAYLPRQISEGSLLICATPL